MDKQGRLTLEIRLNGIKPDEETPKIAAYLLGPGGAVQRKIGVAADGRISLDFDPEKDRSRVVGFGPDVEDPTELNRESLLQFRLRDQLPIWEKDKFIEILPPWWRDWFWFRICVSGRVRKCIPLIFDRASPSKISIFDSHIPFSPLTFCRPICNGVVEVYERTCCCWPWLTIDISDLIRRLRETLAQRRFPIPIPDPGPLTPRSGSESTPAPLQSIASQFVNPGNIVGFNLQPDPSGDLIPVDRVALRAAKRAEALGTPQPSLDDTQRIAQDIRALEVLPRDEATRFIEARPYLWPFWCTCSSRKLGETTLHPDGTFTFCYRRFPILFRPNCHASYYYKVKQWQENQWVYIYDGSQRNQYFTADQFADISTFLGRACGNGDPGYSNDLPFVALQDIGSTRSYVLNSHYNGLTPGGVDLTQLDEGGVAAPPVNGGLCNPSSSPGQMLLVNRPWGADLWLRLHFSSMKATGARYYRISVVAADANGQPVAGATPTILSTPIAWQKFVQVGGQTQIQVDGLGPNPVGGEVGLYHIPYDEDADWLGGQYHLVWDTAAKKPDNSPMFDGLCLVAVEIFDAMGNRMTPNGTNFDFLRLLAEQGANSTSKVPFAKLQHIFNVDNRPVYADIEDLRLNGVASFLECQFMSGTGSSTFSAGYRAFHATVNSGTPPETYMYYYRLFYHRGLNGPTVYFQSGGENEPPTLLAGGAANSTPLTFASMLADPQPGDPNHVMKKCTFALNLRVYAKHTNGSRRLEEYDREDQAAFALEIT